MEELHFPSNDSQYLAAGKGDIDILEHFHPALATYHHVLIIIPAYFTIVKVLGPKIMSNRKPFQLKGVIMLYNIGQILMNLYLLYQYSKLTGLKGLQFMSNVCHPVSSANLDNPLFEKKMIDALYLYYINKILDLLDTVFIILRKKQSQVTFLHVFHHITMVFSTWMTVVYGRDEVSIIFAGLNSFIHVVMYTYYFLASFGPSMQKYLWWKKYITRIQIIQFVIALTCLTKMKMDGCQTSPLFFNMWLFNDLMFLGLFSNFYFKSYLLKSKST